jgi:hypothetical protein
MSDFETELSKINFGTTYNKASELIVNLQNDAVKYQSRIAELERQLAQEREANRWIPVSERLPEHMMPCLVFMKEHNSVITCLWMGKDFSLIRSDGTPSGVTHWKPITPPEAEC